MQTNSRPQRTDARARRRFIDFVVALAAVLTAAAPAEAELLRLPTRPGVTVPVALDAPSGPAAAWAILFVGGDGALNLSESGAPRSVLSSIYLIRSRQNLINAGIGVAVVDVPSDQASGMNRVFRRSPEHLTDVGAIVGAVRQRYGRPVWLIGHSNGAISATAAARGLSSAARPNGVILTSSTAIQNRQMPTDPFRPLAYTGAVMIVAHQNDGCRLSPPSDAPVLLAAFAAARPKTVRMFTGGSGMRGDPCHGASAHSFIGIEAEVMADIAAFIKNRR